MEKIDIAIIGAGVVGLAIASEIARQDRKIFVLERNESFGRETSSRNSEVIHAGIYYETGSLKARTCVEGSALLHEACQRHNIPHKKTGKLIVAVDDSELPALEALYEKGRRNRARDLKMLSRKEVKAIEPNIEASAALFSPWTGIVDSHSLMRYLYLSAKEKGISFAFGVEVRKIAKLHDGFALEIKDADGKFLDISCGAVINSAGLDSDIVAEMAGIDAKKEKCRLNYCKGDYFGVSAGKARMIKHLVYPIPESTLSEVEGSKLTGLGIHATLDLGGSLHLGPNAYYVDRKNSNYAVDESKRMDFYNSVKPFLPFLEPDDLSPERSGIRPKLQGPGEGFRDFVIKEETEIGLPGFVNLIGIESPGLTACLSIARIVKNLVRSYLA